MLSLQPRLRAVRPSLYVRSVQYTHKKKTLVKKESRFELIHCLVFKQISKNFNINFRLLI